MPIPQAVATAGKLALQNSGSIMTGISNLFGGGNSSSQALAQQYKYQKNLMKYGNDLAVDNYKHRYQWQVEDLKNAGIHPWYGIGSAGSLPGQSGSVGIPDTVGEKRNKQDAIMQGLQLVQDWTAKQTENKLKSQQALTEEQNTKLRELEVIEKELKNKYLEPRIKKELEEAKSRIFKNMAESSNINENTKTTARTNRWHKKHPILSEIAIAGQELNDTSKAIDNTTSGITNFLPWKRKQKNTPRKK